MSTLNFGKRIHDLPVASSAADDDELELSLAGGLGSRRIPLVTLAAALADLDIIPGSYPGEDTGVVNLGYPVGNAARYGAVPGSTDSTAAFRRACDAIQSIGTGTVTAPAGEYTILPPGQSTYSGLGDFSNCNGVVIDLAGVVLKVPSTQDFSVIGDFGDHGDLFKFANCKNVKVYGNYKWVDSGGVGLVRTDYEFATPTQRGRTFVGLYGANENVEIDANLTGSHGVIAYARASTSDPRTKNVKVRVTGKNVYYGFLSNGNCENLTLETYIDGVHRAYHSYDPIQHDVKAVVTDNYAFACYISPGPEGIAKDVTIELTNKQSKHCGATACGVVVEVGDIVSTYRGVRVTKLDVEYPTSLAGGEVKMGPAFQFRKTLSGSPDVVDRGHTIENFYLGNVKIRGTPSNGAVISVQPDCKFGSGDTFRDHIYEKWDIVGGAYVDLRGEMWKGKTVLDKITSDGPIRVRTSTFNSAAWPSSSTLGQVLLGAGVVASNLTEIVTGLGMDGVDSAFPIQPRLMYYTTPFSIPVGWSGGPACSNYAWGADYTVQLPAALPGREYTFVRRDGTYTLTLTPATGEAIVGASANQSIRLDTDGGLVKLVCYTAGKWSLGARSGVITNTTTSTTLP